MRVSIPNRALASSTARTSRSLIESARWVPPMPTISGIAAGLRCGCPSRDPHWVLRPR
ncbi:hypothetical protein J4558_01290 [Leptolyngbya sp. 15MV]|nr:hypothetical protein J4558_01290 [Leptolyngbya sp. 15MV]